MSMMLSVCNREKPGYKYGLTDSDTRVLVARDPCSSGVACHLGMHAMPQRAE